MHNNNMSHQGLKGVLEDDEIFKIDRLQLINANARFELLSANQ